MVNGGLSILSNRLRDLTYNPITDWRNFLSDFIRLTVNFGCNVEDVRTEGDVLDSVGSYGYQINRLLDAVSVLVEIELGGPFVLSEEQALALLELKKLATEAHSASERSKALQASHR